MGISVPELKRSLIVTVSQCLFATMKVAVILALCACAVMSANVYDLVRAEVKELLRVDHDLTVDHCTTKCDALFDLADGHDEHATDAMCKAACACAINHVCPHTTTRHPHHGHPTRAPHN